MQLHSCHTSHAMDASRAQRSQARISSRCAGVSHQPARRSVRHASAGAARARSGDSGSGAGDSADRLERTFSDKAADASQLADTFLQPLWAPPQQAKVFVFVRHGHSTWNSQSRIQGNTNESELTALGMAQAVRAREALHDIPFDSCFSSPHTRARQTADIVWQPWRGVAPEPEPHFLHSLSEVDLGWFQGLRNEDIARGHPALYRVWREEPERFELDGRFPVLDAFRQSRSAWTDMLSFAGSCHLVITHKSLLRSMLCTALGLPPRQFRAIDISNGAVCMVRCNARGDMMLSALNLTSHLMYDEVRYVLPGTNQNDRLAAASGYVAATAAVTGGGGGGGNGAAAATAAATGGLLCSSDANDAGAGAGTQS